VRSRSSQRWLQRHVADPFVRRAREAGYRSRAAFKLLEIDARERLLRPGARIVDLGAAPGGWSQVAAQRVGRGGTVVAVDLLEIGPISGVTVLRGDFGDPALDDVIGGALGGGRADVVLCDLSPNLSGIASADQARAAELLVRALDFCRRWLQPDGVLLAKVFQGGEFETVLRAFRAAFREVRARKPAASRDESRETYLVARGLRAASP
jgi:23S rRNA (uridine2552-2'-O)-methyltransferase